MPVKRRVPKGRADDIDPVAWAYLTDDPAAAMELEAGFAFHACDFMVWPGQMRLAGLWEMWRRVSQDVLADWIRKRPGTRPRCWWAFSATEGRRLVAGGGIPLYPEAPADRFAYRKTVYGLPGQWVSGPFPDDPPMFESEAGFLLRRRLFHAGERERVPAAAFKPAPYGDGPPSWAMPRRARALLSQ